MHKYATKLCKVLISPHCDFLTQNTVDLKAMLEAIPKETLEYDVDVFEKDFKEVLNSEKNRTFPRQPKQLQLQPV